MSRKHRAAYNTFSGTFSNTIIKEWTEMAAKWQTDHDAPNPFEETTIGEQAKAFPHSIQSPNIINRDNAR